MKSACECFTWVRLWEETHGGKYPPSDHHPRCKEYRPVTYSRVCVDKTCCVMQPAEVTDFIDGNDPDCYQISTVQLTPDQVEKMGDFAGF